MALGGTSSTFALLTGQEVSVSVFAAGTSQPRQSLKIVSGGLVVHVSRQVNSQGLADNFDINQFPDLIRQGVHLSEVALGLLDGDRPASTLVTTVDTPSAGSSSRVGVHGR